MKKILFAVLTLALLLALSVPALAAEDGVTITLTPSTTTYYPGQSVVLTISVSSTVEYTSIGYKPTFDSNVFEFVSYAKSASAPATINKYDSDKNNLLISMDSPTYSGVLGEITFKVKEVLPVTKSFGGTVVYSTATASQVKGSLIESQIKIECDHDFDSADYIMGTGEDAGIHYQNCAKGCGAIKKEEHSWDDGKENPAPTCTDPGTLIFTCPYCQAKTEENIDAMGHKWDNDCDTTCNNCTHTREVTHQYETVLTGDATGHWYKCGICGIPQGDPLPHTPGPEPTEYASQTCTECQFELKPILPHEHLMSTIWYHNGEEHWYRCEKSGCTYTENKVPHDYDNNCDVDCNTCGEVRIPPHNFNPVWKGTKDGHYYTCFDCNAQSEIYPHTPGPEATQDTAQICTDCNFKIKWELSHVHSYLEVWYSDDVNHWKICKECMEATPVEAHNFTSTVVTKEPTETEAGSQQHVCGTCGKQVTEVLPALGSEPTVPSTAPVSPDTTSPNATNSDGSGRFPWEIAGIAAVLLLLVGIVLLLIEFLRSRKTNMRGRFSK